MSIIEKAVQSSKNVGRQPTNSASQLTALVESRATHPVEPIEISKLYGQGILVREPVDPEVLDQFRNMKRPLLQTTFGPLAETMANLVMITSPLPGAGKTFVSINLANVLTRERDRSVLLVDTDNARGSLTELMGIKDRPGIFDLLNDRSLSLNDVSIPTDVAGLTVIPTGARTAESLELLGSARAKEVFRHLSSADRNRIVILDAPPLLASLDGPVAAALAGQILMIVEAGSTTRSSLTKSLELLDRSRPIGLILNKTSSSLDWSGYGGYGYGAAPT
jgi:Mrp family chromosome partitioning ATPase